jgi:hypothetical protein
MVEEGVMACASGGDSLRDGGAGAADDVARLVDRGSVVHHDAGSVGGDSKVCPVAAEKTSEIGENVGFSQYSPNSICLAPCQFCQFSRLVQAEY